MADLTLDAKTQTMKDTWFLQKLLVLSKEKKLGLACKQCYKTFLKDAYISRKIVCCDALLCAKIVKTIAIFLWKIMS